MPRNAKKMIIGLVVLIVIVLVVIGIVIFTLTDIFKPANITFLKYASKNIDVFSTVFNLKEENEYINKLENNKFESKAIISANMDIKDQEDLSSIINKFVINIDTKSDKPNQKEYQKFGVKYDNSDIINVEYNNQDDIFGLKFPDVVTKYVSVKNSDLKSVADKAGITSDNVPDKIEDYSLSSVISQIEFTDQEKEQLTKKYGELIINTIPKDSFAKQGKQMITIDEKTITAKGYTLNTNKQQLKELAVKLLEQVSSDDIILSKLDKLDSEIEKTKKLDKSIKTQFIEEISKLKDELNKEENKEADSKTNVKITVYEKSGQLVRTAIITDYVKTNIDVTKEDNKATINIESDETTESNYNSYILNISKINEGTTNTIKIKGDYSDNNKTYSGELDRIRKTEGNSLNTDIVANFTQDDSKYELNYKNSINLVDNLNIEEFNDKNNIILNNQSSENVNKVIDIIYNQQSEKLSERLQPILTRIYAETPITQVQSAIENNEDSVKISDADKNNFNSKFEGYTGNKVKNTNLQALLNNVKNYASEVKIDELTGEIVISLNKDIQTPASIDDASSKIDTTKTYTVNLEYDSNNIANKVTIKAN